MAQASTQPRRAARIRVGMQTWATDLLVFGLAGLVLGALLVIADLAPAGLLAVQFGLWLVLGSMLMLATPGDRPLIPGRPRDCPGPANRITLARAALTLPLAGLAVTPGLSSETSLLFAILGLAVIALILDGVDGAVARRTGTVSAFGARFDMELDAAMILALAALAWLLAPVGSWVLLIGVLRYLFLAAAYPAPWLAAPLPPRRRRQTICVLQTLALLVVLFPGIPDPAANLVAGLALATLTGSFALDIRWLYRQGPGAAARRNTRTRTVKRP
ncbi:MAG: CDP-alcohol phosphatidyltransferase family protein [Pseudomonadota bacterium]